MATPQLSPGVLVREVDLTVGRADNVLDNIGAIAGPFPIGPVDYPIDISTEQDLINVFGKPLSTDSQYEYWMSASSYLSYGGVLKVVRTDGSTLRNANAGVGAAATTTLEIKNYDDYTNNYSEASDFTYAAKNPGTWANNLKICFIDNLADQTIGIATTNPSNAGATIGFGVTTTLNTAIAGSGTTSLFNGYLKGIITGVTTDATNGNSTIDVRIVSRVSSGNTETLIDYAETSPTASFSTSSSLSFVITLESIPEHQHPLRLLLLQLLIGTDNKLLVSQIPQFTGNQLHQNQLQINIHLIELVKTMLSTSQLLMTEEQSQEIKEQFLKNS